MNYDDFCELSTLAVLDELDPRDLHLVEEYAQSNPRYQEELNSLAETLNSLAYVKPHQPLSIDLKERLYTRLELDKSRQEKLPDLRLKLAALKWRPHPVVPKVEVSILRVDAVSKEITGYLRCQPNIIYPSHQHACEEEILVLEGDLIIEGQVYYPGDYIYSLPGTIHSPTTQNGCIFYFSASIDDRFIEADCLI